ncbi:paraquat-inducible protein A [Parasulfitobacter algicola]|uniref:Paraquat-inducible protein A n=1 Tax=Parasulfitobacter algicola TaxID=2614809 RepID=A0ABX2INA5_9RHOB|nr:paraquat-inducible protein A [Sulfitobacter algicola]NSX54364.1 paraquat-inducible protein A [Sulfitobacter algicola]
MYIQTTLQGWILRIMNLSLLILFPVAWFAPLMRAGLLPLFGLSEISVISGLQTLWDSDVFLALMVTAFALFAPYLKTIGLGLIQFRLLDRRALPFVSYLGKLAMADIFLVALYVVVFKGVGVGKIEIAWGLYLFTSCIVISVVLSILQDRMDKKAAPLDTDT